MTVMIKKIGGSMAVVIPNAVAREMELTEGMPMEISSNGEDIVMRKQRSTRRQRRPLAKIVAQIKPASYRRRNRELGGDRPVGKELW
jgi:antitoxin component of MazEF toxin-antitoxin module